MARPDPSFVAAVRAVHLFAGLRDRDLQRIVEVATEHEFRPGDVIVRAGDLADDAYVVLAGTAELDVPGGRTGLVGPGDCVGEIAVLDRGPRSATITARTSVHVLRIRREDFLSMLDRHGEIGRRLLTEFVSRMRRSEAEAVADT